MGPRRNRNQDRLALVCALIVLIPGSLTAGQEERLLEQRGLRPDPLTANPAIRERFAQGLELHQVALVGQRREVDAALDWFAALHRDAPEDGRIQAFFGNLLILRAREALPWNKMTWLRRGYRELNQSIERFPDDPHIRAVRAINHAQLPTLLGKRDTAERDFNTLLQWRVEGHPAIDSNFSRFVLVHAAFFWAEADAEKSRWLLKEALEMEGDSVDEAFIFTLLGKPD